MMLGPQLASRTHPVTHLVPEPDGLNHYVRKSEITRSIVEGVAVVALCGTRVLTSAQGNGNTGNRRLQTCAMCSLTYESMKP